MWVASFRNGFIRFRTASKPNKPAQKTLDHLFVKGSTQLVSQAKKLGEDSVKHHVCHVSCVFSFCKNVCVCVVALQAGEVSGCSDEFKSLMTVPTPGALQLKKHLTQGSKAGIWAGTAFLYFSVWIKCYTRVYLKGCEHYNVSNVWLLSCCSLSVSKDATGVPVQSISASDLLKQQKEKQRELLERRRRRAEEIQKRVLQNSSGGAVPAPSQSGLMSPRVASEATKPNQSPAAPHIPTLGRGVSEGDDILFFDNSLPPAPSQALSLSAAKLAALKKLKAKGMGLKKEDPNAVKRKRSNSSEINARVEKNLTSPNGAHTHYNFYKLHLIFLNIMVILFVCSLTYLCRWNIQAGGGGTSSEKETRAAQLHPVRGVSEDPQCQISAWGYTSSSTTFCHCFLNQAVF